MKEEYTAKEILLGLREECLRVQEKLNEVDNFLDYDRDRYRIETYLLATNIESYLLKLCPKKETTIDKIKKAINYPTIRLSRVSKQIDGVYGLLDFDVSRVSINVSKRYDFDSFIKEIVSYNYLKVLNDKTVTNLKVTPTLLDMKIKNGSFIRYWAQGDILEFIDATKKLTKDDILEMLNHKYTSDIITDEAKMIINNNCNISKEIVLKEDRFRHNESFELIENKKTFVLRRN